MPKVRKRPEPSNLVLSGEGSYNINHSTYPIDLMGDDNQYGNNCVVFYINVQEDSRLVTSHKEATLQTGNVDRQGSELSRQTGPGGTPISSNEAGAVFTTGGGVVGATGGAFLLPTSFGTIGGALIGAGATGITVLETGAAKRETKRIVQAIALHTQADLDISYSASWEAGDTALGTAALMAAGDTVGLATAIKDADASKGGSSVSKIAASLIASSVLRDGPQVVSNPLSRLSATAGNPKKEQLFQGVDFRTFDYKYQFWPRSQKEANMVQNIIRLFKLHMHPENVADSHFLWRYPSEFDIKHYTRDENGEPWKENLNIHRHTSCVLTDLTLSYAPLGTYSSLSGGMPTQINMGLRFKEIALLTKETIQDGY